MENASKALIIAGAILVSILLIGLGVALVNSLQGTQQSAQDRIGGTAMSTFNSTFEKYQGKQSGTQIKTLLSDVISNNNSSERQVKVTGTSGNFVNKLTNATASTASISKLRGDTVSSKTYTVSFVYGSGDADKGYIIQIDIK